jgi:small-conductance mechanosensitive channel
MAEWLQRLTDPGYLKEALVTVLILVVAWLAAQLYVFVIDRLVRRWAARTASKLDDQILTALRRPGFILLLLAGVYVSVHRYEFRFRGFVDGLLFVLSVTIAITCLINVLGVLLGWWGGRVLRERPGETVAQDLLPLADKFLKIVLVLIGTIIVLDHFAIDVKSILVTLGVGSLAIGLALQDTLANMFGGFTIMVDRPFRSGDRIQLQTGELGDVQSVGIRSTTVLMLNGNLLIVPNSLLVKNSIINYSVPNTRAQVQIEVGVGCDSDPAKVKRILMEVASGQPGVLADPGPAVFFKAFGEYALQFLIVCQVGSFRQTMEVTDGINTTLNKRLREEAIEIPYPIRRVELSKLTS